MVRNGQKYKFILPAHSFYGKIYTVSGIDSASGRCIVNNGRDGNEPYNTAYLLDTKLWKLTNSFIW